MFLLFGADLPEYLIQQPVIQPPSSSSSPSPPFPTVPSKNGFAHTVIRAWQRDLHLQLRPDDVWLAILTQFTFFVNANAESLRSVFVSHQGQAELLFDARPHGIDMVDVGHVAEQLVAMVRDKLTDPAIATTLLPAFTTTTAHDRATAAMVFLGTVHDYFDFAVRFGCSFPSVTLLGERTDWADMLSRATASGWFATAVGNHHPAVAAWVVRLAKVLEYMVASFDRPDDADVRRFWTNAVHEQTGGGNSSGRITTLSGWLTAFCWWDEDGKRIWDISDDHLDEVLGPGQKRLVLDGIQFPVMNRDKVPPCLVKVPVTLYQEGRVDKAVMLAGSMGMQVLVGKDEDDDETAVRPASGWWMLRER
ncbi:hypothetical protein QBC36DRAFT_387787 [Triangularia setosa]|uniref:Uncharacterized protein n=1 Tax=Triangularia setosa TaxID=2587417 RepID=A0AAN6W5Z6_9PEZI|nr:hypothetical protein QBC36DRAFT_387787 [Podospora setosa]